MNAEIQALQKEIDIVRSRLVRANKEVDNIIREIRHLHNMREEAQASLLDTGMTLLEADHKNATIDACRQVRMKTEMSLADKKDYCEKLERYHKGLLKKLAALFTQ
jgi:predicted  nucleic acid-binding Zn-ribbon protein